MKKLLIYLLIFSHTFAFSQPATWTASGIGGGGSLFSPTISPHNSSDMYMQCDMSEVFHTSNAGSTWEAIPFQKLISTGGIHRVEYTSDPNTLYTVNYGFNEDRRFPVKTINGGVTWTELAGDLTDGDVWFISADPASTNRLLIASYSTLYISTNGGTSFTQVYNNSDLHIAGVFWNGTQIFVGTRYGLLISTNNGASFSLDSLNGIPAGQGFISFTGGNSGGVTRLMGTMAAQADLYPGINALDTEVYTTTMKRDYGSNNWTNAVTGIPANINMFCIASSRNNTNIYYLGGNNPGTSYPVVYKTIDGGNSWNSVFLTNNNQNVFTGYSGYQGDEDWYYGEYVFGLAVGPNDPNTVIYTDFGFAHVTQNGGTSWKQAYVSSADQNPMNSPTPKDKAYGNNGLENTSCWNLHWLRTNNNNIFASYTDITAVRSLDGGAKWSFSFNNINYNTVYHVVEHPTNGTLYAAVSSVHDLYQSTYLTDARIDGGTGAILYSTDAGANWSMLHNFAHPVIWLAIDPNNANRMYASVVHSTQGGIFRSDNLNLNAASTWTSTAAPPRTEGHPYNVYVLNDGAVVSTWSGRRTANFTASSGVYISTNSGSSWSDVSYAPFMHYWTKDITIDPNDLNQNTWYVSVFSGWGGAANDKGGLYKTINRGVSWTKVFDSYRVESCTVDPVNRNKIFATTESEGLWYASNGSSANPTFTQQASYNFMHPVRVKYNPADLTEIWVTSFGNGLKVGTAPSIPLPVKEITLAGYRESTGNKLEWSVREEKDVRSYRVEKSSNGLHFELLSTVASTSSIEAFKKYEYFDVEGGSAYYRISIIEKEGLGNYSKIIKIDYNSGTIPSIRHYPDPVKNELTLEYSAPGNDEVTYSMWSSGNQFISSATSQCTTGINKFVIPAGNLSSGVYLVKLTNSKGWEHSFKFVKH